MKKALVFLAIAFLPFFAAAQVQDANSKPNVTITADGNYIAKAATTKAATPATNSGKTYTDKDGKVFPVYVSSKGAMFINKVSKKTGKEYRYYLRTN